VPGFDAMRKQQEAFLKTIMGGVPGWSGKGASEGDAPAAPGSESDELREIKAQLAELQKKLSKL
jgi:hypothetical protein